MLKEHRMAQLTVSIPDSVKDWCETQVREGLYQTESDYVRELILRDQDRRAKSLQAAREEGLVR